MLIKDILNQPLVFNAFKYVVSRNNLSEQLVDEYIRPFPNAEILDIGCGTGIIRHYLPEYIHYTGIDINESYIKAAQNKFNDSSRFCYGDITALSGMNLPENNYDIILALGLIHHLDDNQAQKVFLDSIKLLKTRGILITFDGVYEQHQSLIAKYILSQDRGKYVRTLEGYLSLIRPGSALVESFVRNDLLRIPYSHCILRIIKA
jgi:2-polyprenyl-3-methyl-5-hydroxy-6-metoxy-1,4-benzoquinol methylase